MTVTVDGNTGVSQVQAGSINQDDLNATLFAASLSPSGYQKLPSGLIIQWGYSAGGSEPFVVTLPTPFPALCASVSLTVALTTDPASSVTHTISTVSLTTFTVHRMDPGSATVTPFYWLAVGY